MLKVNSNLVNMSVEDGAVFFNPLTGEVHIFGQLEAFLLNKYLGCKNVEELIEELSCQFNASYEEIYRDVMDFVNSIKQKGILTDE